MDERLSVLELRLARSERRARWTGWLAAAALVAAAASWFARQPARAADSPVDGGPPAGALRAPFRVVGREGRPLLEVIDIAEAEPRRNAGPAAESAGAELRLFDLNGKVCARLSSRSAVGELNLSPASGNGRALLNGRGSLSLLDRTGLGYAILEVLQHGGTLTMSSTHSGAGVVALDAAPAGGGRLLLSDGEGNRRKVRLDASPITPPR
jgi:hypothetical protein